MRFKKQLLELKAAIMPSLEHLSEMFQGIFDAYNHEVHSVTKCVPYEVFFGRTDLNWAKTPYQQVRKGCFFTEDQKQALYKKNLDGMRKRAAKEVARWYKKHETILAMNDKENPLKQGTVVMVMHWNAELRKKLRSPWVAVAEIENWKTDKHGAHHYKLKWGTQGPTKEDTPGSSSSRHDPRRLLVLPKEGMDVDDLEDLLEIAKQHVFEVECLLAKRFLRAERKWEVLVQWVGYSLESVSWEPKENLAYDVDSVWHELPKDGEDDDVGEILDRVKDQLRTGDLGPEEFELFKENEMEEDQEMEEEEEGEEEEDGEEENRVPKRLKSTADSELELIGITNLPEAEEGAKHRVHAKIPKSKSTTPSTGIPLKYPGLNFTNTLNELRNTPLHPSGSNSLVPPTASQLQKKMKKIETNTWSARAIEMARSTFVNNAPLAFFDIPAAEVITGPSPSNGPYTWEYLSENRVAEPAAPLNFLRDGEWLDDSVISAAMQVLKQRWAGSKVFWVDPLWTGQFNSPRKIRAHFKAKAETVDRYYFPWHAGNHWFSLAYCLTRKKFLIMDSILQRDPA
ncbi:hypothetical protein HK104_011505 [Borealophlyctis nickersoniae]|nr:hypothetical protein HK104_011505 [Borealophlyctis nickersoniae]